MKKVNLLVLYLGLTAFCSSITVAQTITQTPEYSGYSGVIYAGSGYSNDAEQIAPVNCFNTTALPPQNIQTINKLSEAESYMDLQNALHVNISASGGIGQFSSDAEANYMHDVEEKDYSLSLNYYEYSTGTVSLQPDMDPLNNNGKKNYQDNYNYFGLYCGDKYISAYQEGVMLVMALNLDFNSSYEKNQFEQHANVQFSDIMNASDQIEKIADTYHTSGTVTIEAYQKGGDPSQLSNILGPDNAGDYNALTCSLKDMKSCTAAAAQLLDYASNNFSKQYDYTTGEGLTPLGLGFTELTSIHAMVLTPPPTLITTAIINDRAYLSNQLQRYQYYQQKYHQLLAGYPVAWDKSSDIYKTSEKLAQRADMAVNIIMSPDNPAKGALACYSDFDAEDSTSCQAVTAEIKRYFSSLDHKIMAQDLTYLQPIKYYYNGPENWYFYDGSRFAISPVQVVPACSATKITNWQVDSLHYIISGHVFCNGGDETFQYSGNSDNAGASYLGILKITNGYVDSHKEVDRVLSPFYFTAYSPR